MRPIDDLRGNPRANDIVTTLGMDNMQILAGALLEGQVEEGAARDPDRNVNAMNAVLTTIRDMTEAQTPLPYTSLDLAKEVAGVLFQHQPERMQEVHKALEERAAQKEPVGPHATRLAARPSNIERKGPG